MFKSLAKSLGNEAGLCTEPGESGAVLHARRSHTEAVTAFCWVECGAGFEDPAWLQLLPPLLSVPSAPSNMFLGDQMNPKIEVIYPVRP